MPIADARRAAAAELERLAARLREEGHGGEAEIFDAQALMAVDEELLGGGHASGGAGADPARRHRAAGEDVAAIFEALDDEMLAHARRTSATSRRGSLGTWSGGAAPRLERRSIVVAVDLPPSVTVELDRALLAGIALEGGSRTSHAAILARALGIPAVVGVPDLVRRAAAAGELAIDGDAGVVVLDPDEARSRRRWPAGRRGRRRAGRPTRPSRPRRWRPPTATGCCAPRTSASRREAVGAFAAGAEGIGLFRTEFAFAGRSAAPGEDEQADAYAAVLRGRGRARRSSSASPTSAATSRSRTCRSRRRRTRSSGCAPSGWRRRTRELFADPGACHPRARRRAPAGRRRSWRRWSPMPRTSTSSASSSRDARAAVPDAPAPRVGIMVEIPSAVLLADAARPAGRLHEHRDQRPDRSTSSRSTGRTRRSPRARIRCHPAVLRAVARVVEAAAAARDCEVAVCGEMAGDPAGALPARRPGRRRAEHGAHRVRRREARRRRAARSTSSRTLAHARRMTRRRPPRSARWWRHDRRATGRRADQLPGEPARHRADRGDAGGHRAHAHRHAGPRARRLRHLRHGGVDRLPRRLGGARAEARCRRSACSWTSPRTRCSSAGVLVAMVEVGLLPTWMVATILVRELVIAGVRQMAAAERRRHRRAPARQGEDAHHAGRHGAPAARLRRGDRRADGRHRRWAARSRRPVSGRWSSPPC